MQCSPIENFNFIREVCCPNCSPDSFKTIRIGRLFHLNSNSLLQKKVITFNNVLPKFGSIPNNFVVRIMQVQGYGFNNGCFLMQELIINQISFPCLCIFIDKITNKIIRSFLGFGEITLNVLRFGSNWSSQILIWLPFPIFQ